MGRTRKFCGRTTTLWHKCETCEKRESCMKVDKDFTAKEILIDCEGFYYVFKKLEIFEAYPRLEGDVEKHKQDMNEEEYRKNQSSTIAHFYEKLLLLEGMMNTKPAKKIAKERTEVLRSFLEEFYEEWDGRR